NEDIESIFLFSIIIGFFLSAVFYFSSALISDFYKKEELENLSKLMSLIVLLQAIRIVPNALIRKNLQFKQLGIIEVVVQVIGGIVAIVLAYYGFSYYAIIINSILTGFLIFVIFYKMEPIRFTYRLNLESINKILKFSSFQFFFNFINYFSRNLDNLLIGKYFNSEALGFYDRAYKLMLMPVQNLTHVITPVLHPILAEYNNEKKVIYDTYYKIVKFLSLIGFPLSVFLFYNAAEIIYIMYGNQWGESIPVFRLLALTVGIQIVLSSSGSIFQATDRTDLLFYSGLIGSILMISGISYGVFIGKNLESVGFGIIIAFILNFLQGFYLLINKSLGYNFFKFLLIFTRPLLLSIILGIVLWSVSFIKLENYIYSFVIKIFVSIVVFLSTVFTLKSEKDLLINYFNRLFRNK
ncbi:MAG: lipopolysaccharide biosynthesis protein, partial [Ignavibacteriae bacterium]|nr:lipopolysaccharide biosynthesis protein [Ignavibacteriota bacterium]